MSGETAITGRGSTEGSVEIKCAASVELMELLSGSYFPANETPPWEGGRTESTGLND